MLIEERLFVSDITPALIRFALSVPVVIVEAFIFPSAVIAIVS